jgi:hypothetical protein
VPGVTVVLPDGDLIECGAFARAIARAIHPMVEDGTIGLGCILGKFVLGPPWSKSAEVASERRGNTPQTVPLPASVDLNVATTYIAPVRPGALKGEFANPQVSWAFIRPPLDELRNGHGYGREDVFPRDDALSPADLSLQGIRSVLSPSERDLIARLLPDLPPLVWPLTEEASAAFIKCFRESGEATRLNWVPELAEEAEILRRQNDHYEKRMVALGDAIAHNRLSACNADRHHVRALLLGHITYIPRGSAIEYLNSLQIVVSGGALAKEELQARVKEYYINHTAKETAENFGISKRVISYWKAKYEWPSKGGRGRPAKKAVTLGNAFYSKK